MASKQRGGKGSIWGSLIGVFIIAGVIGSIFGTKKSPSNSISTIKSSTIASSKASAKNNNKASSSTAVTSTVAPNEKLTTEKKNTSMAVTTESPTKDWFAEYLISGKDVEIVPADVLYEYGSAFSGKTIVTSVVVEEISSSNLKANTENNTTYSFSIVADFTDELEIKSIKKGSTVIVIGVVDEMNSINILGSGKTVNLKNSHLVSTGITIDEIENAHDAAVEKAEVVLADAAKSSAEAAEAEKQNFMQSCESVSYSDVERNPSKYKGKMIVVTGTVIQVSEGWFNSVTLRVEEDSGSVWYITYSRSDDEERILENDKLTFYGECAGVQSYTSVIGSKITIPAMDAKYYKNDR